MADYLVFLRGENDNASAGRRALTECGEARVAEFRTQLQRLLTEHRLVDQVAAVDGLPHMSMAVLRATPDVADRVRSLPGVDNVIRNLGGPGPSNPLASAAPCSKTS
jgi:hypothetical protein